jgi:Na+-transporting NADH:ubiquinone oxidoreductase subunit NqrE
MNSKRILYAAMPIFIALGFCIAMVGGVALMIWADSHWRYGGLVVWGGVGGLCAGLVIIASIVERWKTWEAPSER